MESPESGLALCIKELIGAKLPYPLYLKVPSEERSPGEEEQDQRGLVLEEFSNFPVGNQRIPVE